MDVRVLLSDGASSFGRWRVVLAAVPLSMGLAVGCGSSSSDGTGKSGSSEGGASGSAGASGASTGGSSTSGAGGHSTSQGGSGGSPEPVSCDGVDAGADACLTCVARACCDAAAACFADAECSEPFATYQACEHDPAVVDRSGCYSTFTRTAGSDAGGGGKHEAFFTCILLHCDACGGPGIL